MLRTTKNVTRVLWKYKGKMETEIPTSLSGKASITSNVDLGTVLETGVYLWTESWSALVTDCPFQLSSFVLSLPHMTLTTCGCWYLPPLIFTGQFPPSSTLGTVSLSSVFNPVPFFFAYLVLKVSSTIKLPYWPYLTPRTPLFYSSSTFYYLYVSLCSVACLRPWKDFPWPSEWASWLKAKLLPPAS